MKKLFLIDLSSLVVQYTFGVMKGRKDKENKLPYIQTRNGAIGFVRRQLTEAGYKVGDEVIVAREGMNLWRFDHLSDYKANRDHSSFEWKQIHSIVDTVFPILDSQFGYKPIYINSAEADDVIGTIAIHESGKKDMTILSSDKDFKQLLQYVENLKIYSPLKKQFVSEDDTYNILNHIARGDKDDHVHSILTYGEGLIINGVRKKKMTEAIMEMLFDKEGNFIGDEYPDVKRGYEINRMLIDFRYVPDYVKQEIIDLYQKEDENVQQAFL